MLTLDQLPLNPEDPHLVVSEAKENRGLDLLGLRAPAEAIANRLLNGVTTVTPAIRYLGLRSWLILRYLKLGGLKSWDAFSRFAAKVEAAVAIASEITQDTTQGVVGRRNVAASIAGQANGAISIRRLTKILATELYAGPSEGLGLGESSGSVPTLTKERGVHLAEAFGKAADAEEILTEISLDDEQQTIDRTRLAQFGNRFTMAKPALAEREWLASALIPKQPRQGELPRIATYCLLLHLSQALGRKINESDVYAAVAQQTLAAIPQELHLICDVWVQFVVRDVLVLLHEAAVFSVLKQLSTLAAPEKRQSSRDAIAALLSSNLDSGLSGLGLKVSTGQPIRDLCAAVDDACGPTIMMRGLNRWSGGLSENVLFEKQPWLQSPDGLALLPVGWMLAARRLEPCIVQRTAGEDLDEISGAYRIGVGAVVLPEVTKWRTSSTSVREIVGWLIHRSVDQHLRIAWSRLAREPFKDVSLIRSDGEDWIYQKDLNPGRATSRLYQSLNWLTQLGFLNASGMTEEGSAFLSDGLGALHQTPRSAI